MIARVMPRAALLAAAGLLLASPIAANDSEAEIGLGGIVLKPSSALRLHIRARGVRVVRRGVGARLQVRPSVLHRRSHAKEGAAPRAVVRQAV